jgi:hypothetical protein
LASLDGELSEACFITHRSDSLKGLHVYTVNHEFEDELEERTICCPFSIIGGEEARLLGFDSES